jgi:hypothetical protein
METKKDISIRRIMLALDMTYMDDLLLKYVLFLSDAMGTIECLYLCHNIRFDFPEKAPEVLRQLNKPLPELLEEKIRRKTADSLKGVNFEVHVAQEEDTAECLKKWQKDFGADLVVFGKKVTYDGSGYLIERVMNLRIPAHLMVLPETAAHKMDKVLVPVDFSKKSAHALSKALEWGKKLNATVHCQHVFAVPKIYFPYVPVKDLKKETSDQSVRAWERFRKKYFPGESIEMTFSFHSDRSVAQSIYDHALGSQSDMVLVPSEKSIVPSTVMHLLKIDLNIPMMIICH